MQTKQQIEHLLACAGVLPNKALGQHFLIDLNLMRLLIDKANIKKEDVVLEVGCGSGSLTEALAERAGSVIAVEYDKTLAEIAAGQLGDADNVTIINSDILAAKNAIDQNVIKAVSQAQKKSGGRILLVANLPYHVAPSVMVNLVAGAVVADGMYVTVQKEVAQRMVAAAGSRHYGTLSIILSAAGEAKIFRKLRGSVFWPQPEVESAMVSFTRSPDKAGRIDDITIFREVLGLFIGHRRKMLRACVKFAAGAVGKVKDWDAIFTAAEVDPKQRGENLSVEDYISIANLCSKEILS